MEPQKQFCYILYNHRNNKTYNGYTVHPERRLKQHNGLLAGGARYTTRDSKLYGPDHWKYLLIIECDPLMNKKQALSLEWHIKYPTCKRPRPQMYSGAKGRIASVSMALTHDKFKTFVNGFKMWANGEFETELRSKLIAYNWPIWVLDDIKQVGLAPVKKDADEDAVVAAATEHQEHAMDSQV